jgi:signal transduction histidine kinase/ligand-binding sensor domain-containing protein
VLAITLIAPTAAADSKVRESAQWLIQTWETEHGLPENSATAMVQAPDGYLWFGTFKGLVRFDGVRFKVFDRSNTPQLPNDGIVNLHLDRAGRLWVSTLAGLVVREGVDWHQPSEPEIPANDFIRTFTERSNGDLLLTTFNGKIFEFAKGLLTELPKPPGARGFGYLGGVDEEGKWWVAQSRFVGRWSGSTWEPIVPREDLNTVDPSTIGFAQARGGGFWLLLRSELRRYSHGAEVSRRVLPDGPGSYWSMTEDVQGNLWICTTDRGMCQVLSNEGMVRWDEQNGISYHGIRFVFEDREKNLWIGTSGGGLQRFKQRRFRNFGPESGLTERVVKSVSPAPDGDLWIATYGKGLFRWTENGITNVPLAGWTNRGLYVQSVLTDRSGRTWVGPYARQLFMFDANGSHRFPPEQTGGNNIVALFEDSRGGVWISGGEGISMFDKGTIRVHGSQHGSAVSGVCCFGEGKDGVIWLSNLKKVFRLEQERFVEVRDSDGQSVRGITCLRGEPDGSMWMGSVGFGLLRWRDGTLVTIDADVGLPSLNVHGIVEDSQGFWWMPSNRGVMRIHRSELQAVADGRAGRVVGQLLDLSDGLGAVECPSGQQPVCARDAQGRLWFATIKGVAMVDPSRFRANTLAPVARIEEVDYHISMRGSVSGAAIHRLVAPFREPLELPAGSRGIEIHYTAPSFVSPEKVSFQVSLDGEDLDWSEVGNRRVAYFDELKPGDHIFQVRAANDDGLWNQNGASLSLKAIPFFWQTGLFRSLGAAIVCVVVLMWSYRHKINLERKRAAQEAFTRQLILSQENERKRVAGELHDGLGQDLLLIKNRLAMLTSNGKHSPELTRQLKEISATASEAIADVRSISHALRPTALEQVGLTKAIEWMVEQNAEASTSKFSTELENIDGLLSPEMEINLYRILQEALNNVIKHAQASGVIVQIKREPAQIAVSIFDNGRGFETEHPEHNGEKQSRFGLTGMAQRAKVIGGKLQIQSAPGTGTRLTVEVPVARL